MSSALFRLPAEWETHESVLLSWPHSGTDWAYMLDRVTECYIRVAEAIVKVASIIVVCPDSCLPKKYLSHLPQDKIKYIELPTNDTWARDFGPLTVVDGDGIANCLHFRFNGWGLKFASNFDNRITHGLFQAGVLDGFYENRQGFVLEGGSIESDGKGTILTTTECLMSPNRNSQMAQDEIERYILNAFGARRVLWLDHGFLAGDDTDSHIDTLARLAPDDTIVYVGAPDDSNDIHFEQLSLMENQLKSFNSIDGKPYRLVKLPFPDPVYDESGDRLPATYANYLVISNTVLVPTYSQPDKDTHALAQISSAFPNFNVIGIDCSPLICQHGSLHCITMQINPKTI